MPLKDRYNSRSRNRRSRSRSQIEKEKPSILGTRSSQVHDEGERKTYDYSENQSRLHNGRTTDKKDLSCKRTTSRSTNNNNNTSYESSQQHKYHSSSRHDSSISSRIECDDEGHLIFRRGERLHKRRYKIAGVLGEGTFGRVLKCQDRKYDKTVAVKVIKNNKKYRDAAKLEIEVLRQIKAKDPENKHFCIDCLGSFYHGGHVCLVFPRMGKSVYEFMEKNSYIGYPLSQVQHMARQLLDGVSFLHSIKLTHTDLKPENLLLVDSSWHYWQNKGRSSARKVDCPDIKIIDFGSATFEDEHHSSIVSTRHYRALEIILGLGWSYPCDVWSCGCIIFELFTGDAMFRTRDNREHLAMMERILGDMPPKMIRSSNIQRYFKDDKVLWNDKTQSTQLHIHSCVPLKRTFKTSFKANQGAVEELHDLVSRLLVYEPEKRMTSNEALQHPFFKADIKEQRTPSK